MNRPLERLSSVATALLLLASVGCPDDSAPASTQDAVDSDTTPNPAERTWSVLASSAAEAFMSVGGSSASDVWVVGADKGLGPAVLRWDGTAWERLATGHRGDLWWVHAFPGGPVYLGGASAAILEYKNGSFTRMVTGSFGRETVYGIWGSAPDDLYAVGGYAGRDGFIIHYDGTSWSRLPEPPGLALDVRGDIPGFFKVWGRSADEVYVVGGRGTLLRGNAKDGFTVLATTTTDSLFTVAGDADTVAICGGASNGIVLEGDGTSVAASELDSPPLLQGIAVSANEVVATGGFGTVLSSKNGGVWQDVTPLTDANVESLHAAWLDPDGGLWTVGGGVVTAALNNGAILYGGAAARDPIAAALVPKANELPPAPTTCPKDAIELAPGKSIARRWNEQLLNAVRRDIPRPTVHARNLYHVSAAMWDAWAAYEPTAKGVFVTEKATFDGDVEDARREAISYAAFRVLTHRYSNQIGGKVSSDCFSQFLTSLGYDPADTVADGTSPRALGNRIADAIIDHGQTDGANEENNYKDNTGWVSKNAPLFVDTPENLMVDPMDFQPLNLTVAVTQNGIAVDSGVQGYIGAQWRDVTPFSMVRPSPGALYHTPGVLPKFDDKTREDVVDVIRKTSWLDPTDPATMDISPGAFGNNPLGTNDGSGFTLNPATGQPYAPNVVPRADFGRVLAEFWADGPKSETPPGHWNTLANSVTDAPEFERLWEGEGEPLDALEWDVRMYLALNGAEHDAAIACWEVKRTFTTSRPISLIRYMGTLGQKSDPGGPGYHADGLPLVPGLVEVVTAESSAPGERHETLARYVGHVVVRSWRGEPGDIKKEVRGVGWIRAAEWLPYQKRTFVTPAFPGLVSGHSTYSRAGAEVLTQMTGSPHFPGGLGEFVAKQNGYMTFELGPTVEVRLQWSTYYDAADQAGQSRIWGGIHYAPDDFEGRKIGKLVGLEAFAKASEHFPK